MAASLTQILEHLGTTVLDLVTGDPDLAGPAREIAFFDPYDPAPLPHASVVLGAGDAGEQGEAWARQVIRAAVVAQAPAVILPAGFITANPETVAAARGAGLVLLALSAGTTWQQLSSLLDSALRESALLQSTRRETVRRPTAVPTQSEGLFRLANAICTLIDAPVTIEDRNANVLAFSDRQDEADFIRIDCILGRRTIEPYLRVDEERGAVRAIRRSRVPVYLDAVELDDDRPTLPRLAMAIRAGDEFLGTIWAVVQGPPTADQEQLLLEASRSVAFQLLRQHLGADPEQRTTADLVAVALGGGPGAAVAMTRLGLADVPCLVLAASVAQPDVADLAGTASSTLARRVRDRERTATALRVQLTGSTPGSVVAVVNDQIYAIVPARRPQDAALNLTHTCRAFVQQYRATEPILIGIGRVVTAVAGLRLSRADADRAVRVLQEAGDGRSIAQASAVEVEALLLEARQLVELRGRGPSGAYARLLAYDEARNATMIDTLRAWLDAHGDVVIASEQSHVHQNTFRYRLRRISEIGGFALDDPEARFALDLQLRLFLQRTAPAVHEMPSRSAASQTVPSATPMRRKVRLRAEKVEYPSTTPA
ncbi:DNA-binding PucR family transcriptional regulator [Kribbella sp. VKM Ac-2527]|uniref:DNA-binding PucR family transcriptional regulator n=1 Tax=Kribbella caucasensis TaxID=2512215 RepID=A0A4V3C4Z8_9ACTN|nr:helix-turn-helix domain-containing protein [Kribbella sp. VKM Ac-2527]TDO27818.1 DNA-binding PucR family transcriptional regulator [Kribbella sp. VKM Ac-2527]